MLQIRMRPVLPGNKLSPNIRGNPILPSKTIQPTKGRSTYKEDPDRGEDHIAVRGVRVGSSRPGITIQYGAYRGVLIFGSKSTDNFLRVGYPLYGSVIHISLSVQQNQVCGQRTRAPLVLSFPDG